VTLNQKRGMSCEWFERRRYFTYTDCRGYRGSDINCYWRCFWTPLRLGPFAGTSGFVCLQVGERDP
jgi:hypothetical protein